MCLSILLSKQSGTNAWGKMQKDPDEALGLNKSTTARKQCTP